MKEDRSKLLSQALDWVVMEECGLLTLGQRKKRDAWLAQSGAHRAEYARAVADNARINAMLATLPADYSVEPPKVSRRQVLRGAVVAGGVAALLGAGIFWRQVGTRYVTGAADDPLDVWLPGMQLTLNRATEVRVGQGGAGRAALVHGEAFFMVTAGASPLLVAVGSWVLRALEASFGVRMTETGFDLTLQEGVLEVLRSAGPVVRLSGPKAGLFAGTDAPVLKDLSAEELRVRLAWRHPERFFDDTPASEVVAELNRHLPRRIVITNPDFLARRISGAFPLGDLEAAVKSLKFHLNAQVKEVGNDIELF